MVHIAQLKPSAAGTAYVFTMYLFACLFVCIDIATYWGIFYEIFCNLLNYTFCNRLIHIDGNLLNQTFCNRLIHMIDGNLSTIDRITKTDWSIFYEIFCNLLNQTLFNRLIDDNLSIIDRFGTKK